LEDWKFEKFKMAILFNKQVKTLAGMALELIFSFFYLGIISNFPIFQFSKFSIVRFLHYTG